MISPPIICLAVQFVAFRVRVKTEIIKHFFEASFKYSRLIRADAHNDITRVIIIPCIRITLPSFKAENIKNAPVQREK